MKLERKIEHDPHKYSNPYFSKKRKIGLRFSWRSHWKFILILSTSLILLGALIWLFYFSKFMEIKTITINGLKRIPEINLEKLAWEQTEKRKFFIGSERKIALFDANNLKKRINEQYYLENINIKKKLPGTIIINVTEKQYALVWLENNQYYLVSDSGIIIDTAKPEDIKIKVYPLIVNRGSSKIAGQQIQEQEKINYILNLFKAFKNNQFSLTIEQFIIDDEPEAIKMKIGEGPTVYFNIKNDLLSQLSKLTTILSSKISEGLHKDGYIDLRFGDTIFYK